MSEEITQEMIDAALALDLEGEDDTVAAYKAIYLAMRAASNPAPVEQAAPQQTVFDHVILPEAAPVTVPSVEQVENAVGMVSNAWDCVRPELLIEAVLECAAAPAAPSDAQWISVEDHMPEAEVDVIVHAFVPGFGSRFAVAGLFHGEWLSNDTESELRFTPTHWMPLPDVPAALSQQKESE